MNQLNDVKNTKTSDKATGNGHYNNEVNPTVFNGLIVNLQSKDDLLDRNKGGIRNCIFLVYITTMHIYGMAFLL